MSAVHPDDPLFDAIAGLPPVEPNRAHSERVRSRCRAAFQHTPVVSVSKLPLVLEPATVGTVCTIYAWHVVKIAMRMPLP